MSIPLSVLLTVPAYLEALRLFMSSEFCEETVLFYIACTKYEKQTVGLLEQAKHIFHTYVSMTALFYVELPKILIKEIQLVIANQAPTAALFDSAKQTVVQAIEKDLYPRFVNSPSYLAMVEQREWVPLPSRELAKKSQLLRRSLQIAATASRGNAFLDKFYETLCAVSPESNMLFQSNSMHRETALQSVLSSMLNYLDSTEKQFCDNVFRLADVHLRIGVTQSMFEAFGNCMIHTFCDYLLLDPSSLESVSIAHHWRAAYCVLANEMIISMAQLAGDANQGIAKGGEATKWSVQDLVDYKSYISLTLMLISKRGKDQFVAKFFTKFFELSPESAVYFQGPAHQAKALWGALNAVGKMLENPKKLRPTLAGIAAIHKAKGITQKEAALFVRALRWCFRAEIGPEYTERMDAAWKQFLEMFFYSLGVSPEEALRRSERFSLGFEGKYEIDTYAAIVKDLPIESSAKSTRTERVRHEYSDACDTRPRFAEIAEQACFVECVDNPAYAEALHAYLGNEWEEDRLLFYLATKQYQVSSVSLVVSERMELARQIQTLYLGQGALFSIDLPPNQVQAIIQAIKSRSVSSSLFDDAVATIATQLESVHRRFMSSNAGRTLRGLEPQGGMPPKRSIKASAMLARLLQIAMAAAKAAGTFSAGLYKQLFVESPEAKMLFSSDQSHQDAALQGLLTTMMTYLNGTGKEFTNLVSKIANSHVKMRVTKAMFDAFGNAIVTTLGQHLFLDPSSLEWHAIDRHWRTAYDLVTQEVLTAITHFAFKSKGLFSRDDTPKWLIQQFAEFQSYTALTIMLVSRIGNDHVMEAFYAQFFELSPGSAVKFASSGHQAKAFYGVLDTVTKLLKHPRKMRKVLERIQFVHRNKGICNRECTMFVTALRNTFRSEIGVEYTAKMDAVWKQILEFTAMHASSKEDDGSRESKHSDRCRVSSNKPNDSLPEELSGAGWEPHCMADILASPPHVQHVVAFYAKEFMEENILFYIKCMEFKSQYEGQPVSELLAAAKGIFALYIQSASLFNIGCPQSITRDILHAIANESVTLNMFDAAQANVVQHMERDFEAFIRSGSWLKAGSNAAQTPMDKPVRQGIRQSSMLGRSLQLASTKGTFSEALYQALFQISPEAKILFQNNPSHQDNVLRGFLSHLLTFLKQNDKQFVVAAKQLAATHLQMGITHNMFRSFGAALIATLQEHVCLEEHTLEWQAIKRHWQTAYDLISHDILFEMKQLEPEANRFFNRSKGAPRWLLTQLVEYRTFTSLTFQIIARRGNDVFQAAFFARFSEASPESISKFGSPDSQKTALWGAMETVVKLLKKPYSMRKAIAKVEALHRTRGITYKEYVNFARELRSTFRTVLGEEYTERMDVVWKQYLDLILFFLAEKDDRVDDTSFETLNSSVRAKASSRVSDRSGRGSFLGQNSTRRSFLMQPDQSRRRQTDDAQWSDEDDSRPRRSSRLPFVELLKNPTYLEAFRSFMSSEFQDEKMLFYLACVKFEQGPQIGITERAKKIYELYLDPTSLFRMKLPQSEVDFIVTAMTNKGTTLQLFQNVKARVVDELEKNAYPRFLRTAEWRAVSTGQQLDPAKKYLGSSDRNSRTAIQQSALLRRSFELVTDVNKEGESFSDMFSQELFSLSPESQLLFARGRSHQATALKGALSSLLMFLESSENEFLAATRRLSAIHFQMGITRAMFSAFGDALIVALQKYLAMDTSSLEWEAIQAHWRAVFGLIAKQIVGGMAFVKNYPEAMPKWLDAHFVECRAYVALANSMIERSGREKFAKAFFEQFFSQSPESVQKFDGFVQSHALWGAIDSVAKILEHPKNAKQILDSITLTHQNKGITEGEYTIFVQTLRQSLRRELGTGYTDKMDAMWKQYLEFIVVFFWGKQQDLPPEKSLRFNFKRSEDSQMSLAALMLNDVDLLQSSPSHRNSESSYRASTTSVDARNYGKQEEASLTDFLSVSSNADMLWEFMRGEFYEEHMLLYKACQRYKTSSDRLGAARDIFSLYLQPGSIFYCNLPQTHAINIQREIEMGAPSLDLFDPQKDLVVQQMQKDSFARFMATEMGRVALGLKRTSFSSRGHRTLRQSAVVSRLFAIALADPGFTTTFFNALARASPEAESLLSASGHPSAFKSMFASLLALLRQSERQFSGAVRRLAKSHLRMGTTRAMFEVFGVTLQQVVRSYISFNLTSEEAAALDRHWNGVYGLMASEILQCMTQLAPESKGFFSKSSEVPKWQQQYLAHCHDYASQTMLLVKKLGFDRFQNAFFAKFFELSPVSEQRFGNPAVRSGMLLAAMNAVVKLVKKPRKMRKNLIEVANIHKDKGITNEEYTLFVSALLSTLQSELGQEFSPQMSLCWKQFLELYLVFLSQGLELMNYCLLRPVAVEDDASVSDGYLSDRSPTALSPLPVASTFEDYLRPPAAPHKPGSFWDIMLDPAKFEMLRAFANDEFKEENFLFYLACTKFQKCSQASMESSAAEIYRRYLSPNALFIITVEAGEAGNVMQALAEQKINLHTFDRSKAMVLKAIDQDTYKRFSRSPMGRLLYGVRDTSGSSRASQAKKQRAIQDSTLIRRSFELISRPDAETSLVDLLFLEFFKAAPEAEALFQLEHLSHLGASFLGVLNNLMLLSNINHERMADQIKGLAEVHATVGVTNRMFDAFGTAILATIKQKLELDPASPEWEAVSRHWQAMYETLVVEMTQHMVQLGPAHMFSKNDANAPPYIKRFSEFEALATQTVALVGKVERKFAESFSARFFQASPQSAKKFESTASQSKCILGALNSVVGMLENTRKFRQTVVQIAKIHRCRGITRPEFVQFIQCFTETLRQELGAEYTSSMDGVWKRCLGQCELFLGDDSLVVSLGPPPPPQSPERAPRESAAFAAVLADPVQFEAFQTFTQNEFTEEHLLFHLACIKFREHAQTQSDAEMLHSAQNIVSLYLGPASLFFVGLPQKVLRKVLSAIQSKDAHPDMLKPLDDAAVRVLRKELYPKFRAHKGHHNEREAIKQSLLLSRALQLIVTFNVSGSFCEAFFNQLFVEAPETKYMFMQQPANKAKALQGVLKTFLQFLKQPTKQHLADVKRIAALHLQMGVTENMLLAVGAAVLKTLNAQLLLDESGLEWAAIERHFRAVCRVVVADVVAAISDLPEVIYKEREVPKWILAQDKGYASCIRQSIQLVTKHGDEAFMEAFYNKFFELSPASARRFVSVVHQRKAIWGAMKTIAKLLEKPTKVRRTLGKVAKLHRGKGIAYKEFVLFARALRLAFHSELGDAFSEQMDAIWKQFLDLSVQFIAEKSTVEIVEQKPMEYEEEEDEFSEFNSEYSASPRDSQPRTSVPRSSTSLGPPVEMKIRGAEMLVPFDDDPRNKLAPREAEFLKQICPEGRLTSPSAMSGFFHFVQKCPPPKRLDVLNQYFMTSFCQPAILEEMLKQSQWKHWLLPISAVPDTEEKAGVRARLTEYMTLMILEVFGYFFREFDENKGILTKFESEEIVALDFEKRGKEATMADFLADAIAYISLLHSRRVTTRILTAFITKLAAWNNASFKPRWAAPTVSEKAWPNFFSMLAGIEEYVFFSNRKEKSALRKEREFSLGQGPVFVELPLVTSTCKLLQKLKFDRWGDMPESDVELQKLQTLFQSKGIQEEAFFVGLRDFFALTAGGDQVSQAVPAFVTLLMARKAPYGSKVQIEKQVARFLGTP